MSWVQGLYFVVTPLAVSLALSRSLSLFPSLSLCYYQPLSFSLSLSFSLTLCLSVSCSTSNAHLAIVEIRLCLQVLGTRILKGLQAMTPACACSHTSSLHARWRSLCSSTNVLLAGLPQAPVRSISSAWLLPAFACSLYHHGDMIHPWRQHH